MRSAPRACSVTVSDTAARSCWIRAPLPLLQKMPCSCCQGPGEAEPPGSSGKVEAATTDSSRGRVRAASPHAPKSQPPRQPHCTPTSPASPWDFSPSECHRNSGASAAGEVSRHSHCAAVTPEEIPVGSCHTPITPRAAATIQPPRNHHIPFPAFPQLQSTFSVLKFTPTKLQLNKEKNRSS